MKPQSIATAKHNFQQLVFNPANQKLFDFLDELSRSIYRFPQNSFKEPADWGIIMFQLCKNISVSKHKTIEIGLFPMGAGITY